MRLYIPSKCPLTASRNVKRYLPVRQIKRSNPWLRAQEELKRHQTALQKADQAAGTDSDSEPEPEQEPESEPEPAEPQPPAKRRRRAPEPDEDGTVEVKDCSIVVQKVENDSQVSSPQPGAGRVEAAATAAV